MPLTEDFHPVHEYLVSELSINLQGNPRNSCRVFLFEDNFLNFPVILLILNKINHSCVQD